ncbi:hypothetical protein [Puniceicoccus vermicola]|uniref:Uncharacterized protein n=1 Tax=Puniceicoccus vermicola TaxID=388746 RepID=A0A7X1B066_9BACT|nr:hypothetical protein [Puniceicoccus vermicola]MBC2602070.1 hypothetical protein [Puniceicoccus vermicola]
METNQKPNEDNEHNRRFFENIGRCLFVCQLIELKLAITVCFYKYSKEYNSQKITDELAKCRNKSMGELIEEFRELKKKGIRNELLNKLSSKRNWLVHHLLPSPEFVLISEKQDHYTDELLSFFTSAHDEIEIFFDQNIKSFLRMSTPPNVEELRSFVTDLEAARKINKRAKYKK